MLTRLRALTILSLCLAACSGCGQTISQQTPSSSSAVEYAARTRAYVRVFADDTAAEGRIVSLRGNEFRIDERRMQISSIDSLFVRQQRAAGARYVVAGAGIGALVGLVVAEILGYADYQTGARITLAGGGAALGAIGMLILTGAAETSWERRWPPGPSSR